MKAGQLKPFALKQSAVAQLYAPERQSVVRPRARGLAIFESALQLKHKIIKYKK